MYHFGVSSTGITNAYHRRISWSLFKSGDDRVITSPLTSKHSVWEVIDLDFFNKMITILSSVSHDISVTLLVSRKYWKRVLDSGGSGGEGGG